MNDTTLQGAYIYIRPWNCYGWYMEEYREYPWEAYQIWVLCEDGKIRQCFRTDYEVVDRPC